MDAHNCPTCGAPTKDNGRYAVDLGMLCGFEAGQKDSELLRQDIHAMLQDDCKLTGREWTRAMKRRIRDLKITTGFEES
jgi:hypothetical protein